MQVPRHPSARSARAAAGCAAVVALALVAAGCSAIPPAKVTSSGRCATVQPGTLTLATYNPPPSPWFVGTPPDGSPWAQADPESGRGFESAMGYDIARRLGYARQKVQWLPLPFQASYAPGPKVFDAFIGQVTNTPARAGSVDFSPPYFPVPTAVLVRADSPAARASTRAEMQELLFGAQVGTTVLDAVNEVVQPTQQPRVYDDQPIVVRALVDGQVDAVVLDLPTAANVARTEAPGTRVIATLRPKGPVDQLGIVTQKSGPMTRCIREAVTAMRRDGTLQRLQRQWVPIPPDLPEIRRG